MWRSVGGRIRQSGHLGWRCSWGRGVVGEAIAPERREEVCGAGRLRNGTRAESTVIASTFTYRAVTGEGYAKRPAGHGRRAVPGPIDGGVTCPAASRGRVCASNFEAPRNE